MARATRPTDRHLEHRVQVLKAVAHPIRLRVLERLAAGPEHVGALAAALEVPAAIVSQQLRILRMNGVVAVQRKDGHAVYRLSITSLKSLLRCMDQCCRSMG